jgi:DNA-binding transcriptional MerR regulator
VSYAVASPARVKSPEAFRTISEVADELRVPQHVLRFWESRFAQVRPVKRAGGRRYYRPEDIDLLRGIRALLYGDGFTVKGVQKILRDRGARYVIEIGRSVIPEGMVLVRDDSIDMDDFTDDVDALDTTNVVPIARPVAAPVSELVRTTQAAFEEEREAAMAEEERERLEILLAELVQLKVRLRAVRA